MIEFQRHQQGVGGVRRFGFSQRLSCYSRFACLASAAGLFFGAASAAAGAEGILEENGADGIRIGPVEVGGALRANYVFGDYPTAGTGGPSRGGSGGNFELDTFRINLGLDLDPWGAAAEYRFYDGYNMLHTGWLGREVGDAAMVKVGVHRAPFGAGPYGVSRSWFFDQHYYLGLADNMDLGILYSREWDALALDLAYYARDEFSWRGGSRQSARYSYDVVNETGSGYRQQHQGNARLVWTMEGAVIPTDVGVSARVGGLKSSGPQGDGLHYAAAAHMINRVGSVTLGSQLSYYRFRVKEHELFDGRVTDKLVDMGAYDFPNAVAAEGFVPAVSLSYLHEPPSIGWLDSVRPYVEWSAVLKRDSSFNDSHMITAGAAWASGKWYVYTEMAVSDGNEFVG